MHIKTIFTMTLKACSVRALRILLNNPCHCLRRQRMVERDQRFTVKALYCLRLRFKKQGTYSSTNIWLSPRLLIESLREKSKWAAFEQNWVWGWFVYRKLVWSYVITIRFLISLIFKEQFMKKGA